MSDELNLEGLNFATGWVDLPDEVTQVITADGVKPVGAVGLKSWDGKAVVNLGRYMDKVHGTGKWTLNQGQCGSCVAFGATIASDILIAVGIVEHGDDKPGRVDPMTIYGGSRVQIGRGQIGGQGSVGAWAAKWLRDYGALIQKKYGGVDLTTYSPSECCSTYGRRGCPEALFAEARKHPVKEFSQAKTRQDVGDSIANGYPVTVASNQGFSKVRDQTGKSHAQGSWGHQMCIIGVREDAALVINSWGDDWNSGPLVDDQPPGSFWADWDIVVNRMLSAGDSFSLSGINGWESKGLNFLGLNWS